MTLASKSLKRLAALYAVVEEARSTEMRQTTGLLLEVEDAIASQKAVICRSELMRRNAIEIGDRFDWLVAEIQSSVADDSVAELSTIRTDRRKIAATARAVYAASRLQSEQMRRLLENSQTNAKLLAERQSQAVADDRFLSRRSWQALKQVVRQAK